MLFIRFFCLCLVSIIFCVNKISADSVYVTDDGANLVYVINVKTNSVTDTITLDPGASKGIALSPDGNFVFVVVQNDPMSVVDVISTASNSVGASIPIEGNPFSIAITPDGLYAYVTNEGTFNVSAINIQSQVVTTIPIFATSVDIAITPIQIAPHGFLAYVTTNDDTVAVIDTSSNSLLYSIPVGSAPNGIAITPNGDYAYVANLGDGNVSVLDVKNQVQTPIATIPVGMNALSGPFDVAITPDGSKAYVTLSNENAVTVIDTATNTVIVMSITVGLSPTGIAVSSDGLLAYVANNDDETVSAIDLQTNNVTSITIPAGSFPFFLVITPITRISEIIQGVQIRNRFLTQTDLVNIITWQAPNGFVPVLYKVFRNSALTDLAAELPPSTPRFEDHNRKKNQSYNYFVIAIDDDGSTILVGDVVVP